MTAEQFRDAIAQVTGIWYDKPEGGLDALLFEAGEPRPLPVAAFWIWSDPHAAEGVPPQTAYFRRTIHLPEVPAEALAFVNVDNTHRLWVNGREARRGNNVEWNETSTLDLRPFLKQGPNTFAIEAGNGGAGPNPAGLLFYARLRTASAAGEPADAASQGVLDFATDASWRASTNKLDGWQQPDFDDADWSVAQVLGPPETAPWNLGQQFAAAVSGEPIYGRVRAALVAADPLALALGRPNREQVITSRPYTATTIQMLELTNGGTLSRILKTGAEQLSADADSGRDVVEQVFRRALSRNPTPEETELSLALIGEKPARDGVEDLLWSVAMLPEFQLIY